MAETSPNCFLCLGPASPNSELSRSGCPLYSEQAQVFDHLCDLFGFTWIKSKKFCQVSNSEFCEVCLLEVQDAMTTLEQIKMLQLKLDRIRSVFKDSITSHYEFEPKEEECLKMSNGAYNFAKILIRCWNKCRVIPSKKLTRRKSIKSEPNSDRGRVSQLELVVYTPSTLPNASTDQILSPPTPALLPARKYSVNQETENNSTPEPLFNERQSSPATQEDAFIAAKISSDRTDHTKSNCDVHDDDSDHIEFISGDLPGSDVGSPEAANTELNEAEDSRPDDLVKDNENDQSNSSSSRSLKSAKVENVKMSTSEELKSAKVENGKVSAPPTKKLRVAKVEHGESTSAIYANSEIKSDQFSKSEIVSVEPVNENSDAFINAADIPCDPLETSGMESAESLTTEIIVCQNSQETSVPLVQNDNPPAHPDSESSKKSTQQRNKRKRLSPLVCRNRISSTKIPKVFSSKSSSVSPSKRLQCNHCDKDFSSQAYLTIHIRKFHSDQAEDVSWPNCRRCGFDFSLKSIDGTYLRCGYETCQELKFRTIKELWAHHRSECLSEFKQEPPKLVPEVAASEMPEVTQSEPVKEVTEPEMPEIVQNQPKSPSKFTEAAQNEPAGKLSLTCAQCGQRFSQKSWLVSHQRSYHGNRVAGQDSCLKCDLEFRKCQEPGSNPPKFLCTLGTCDQVFQNLAEFRSHHKNKCTGGTSIGALEDSVCESNGEMSSLVTQVPQDQKKSENVVTNGRGSFPCPDCGKLFRESRHAAIHRTQVHVKGVKKRKSAPKKQAKSLTKGQRLSPSKDQRAVSSPKNGQSIVQSPRKTLSLAQNSLQKINLDLDRPFSPTTAPSSVVKDADLGDVTLEHDALMEIGEEIEIPHDPSPELEPSD